jgi:hypothetical protein
MFHDGPLAAATFQLERDFDNLPELAPSIRVVFVLALPFFPPLTFYAVLTTDDERKEVVELLDFTVDEDYFELIDDDPSDE